MAATGADKRAAMRRHRWNSIGRTRRRLAQILTAYARAIPGADGKPRYPGAVCHPERIHAMRLAGKARIWEDAHSWEAYVTNGPNLMSYASMTEIVKAGRVYPVGKDGELDCA